MVTRMKKQQAFQFKLNATPTQTKKLAQFAGCRRYVFNKALELQVERRQKGEKHLGYFALCKQVTEWRNSDESTFLADAPAQSLQQAVKDLERAFQNFFAGQASFPRFKKRGKRDSFRYPQANQFKLDEKNNRIYLPKLGWIRYRNSRDVSGSPKQITVFRLSDGWYVSIQTEQELIPQRAVNESAVGIDVGITTFATLSDGTKYAAPNAFRKSENKLATAQRKLSRKQRFSANWSKQARRVRKIHQTISNIRRDFLHKVSTIICKNHAVVVIEDLSVKSMSASASGTLEDPGKHVKAKSGLNKSILDQGWGTFRRFLEYKLAWSGGILIAVPPKHTSTSCSSCGFSCKENRTSQAIFACLNCGHKQNADLNAAQNILAAGRAVIACGEKALAISMKQEPTVSTIPIV